MVRHKAADGQSPVMGNGQDPKLGVVIDAILDALAAEDVRRLLDIGCGRGSLAAALVRRGYAVTGIDPQQDAINTARRRAPGAVFHRAGAEKIPVKDMSFGAVVLQNALHHIPVPLMRPALNEVSRVLRHSGVLVVLEPLARGSFFDAMRPVDDETVVRRQALSALGEFEAQTGWARVRDDVIDRVSTFADVQAFISYLQEADPNRPVPDPTCHAQVAAIFARVAERSDAGFKVTQPHLLRVLRKTTG